MEKRGRYKKGTTPIYDTLNVLIKASESYAKIVAAERKLHALARIGVEDRLLEMQMKNETINFLTLTFKK